MKGKLAVFGLCIIGVSSLSGIIVSEALASAVLHSTIIFPVLPRTTISKLRTIYDNSTRRIIQFETGCTRFDDQVTYTLRPGVCRFGNPEFDTTLHVNSAGFRDSEDALNAPDVILLGDSFTLGWGVEDADTYGFQLRSRTGLRVLNTGISSYGTVRERIGMSRVALQNLKYLVIQYCPNDLDENINFYVKGNTHRGLSHDQFDRVIEAYQESRRYYPGKSVDLLSGRRIFGRLFGRDPWAKIPDMAMPTDIAAQKQKPQLTSSELFVNALKNAGPPLPASLRKIIVFSLPSNTPGDQEMIEGLQAMKARHELDQIPGEFVILNTPELIRNEDYFALDDHIRPAGHLALANAVASYLPARETSSPH